MRCPSSGRAEPPPLRIIYNFSVGRHPCVPPPDNHRAPQRRGTRATPYKALCCFRRGRRPRRPDRAAPSPQLSTFRFQLQKRKAPPSQRLPTWELYPIFHASMPRLVRYFFTISATLKVMASSNSRRSSPVSFLIFSSRYTSVLRWTNSLRAVSDTLRLFSKNL